MTCLTTVQRRGRGALASILLATGLLASASAEPSPSADALWRWVDGPVEGVPDLAAAYARWQDPPDRLEGRVSLDRWLELKRRQTRQRGLVFWRSFPADGRRWFWLAQTVTEPPAYWSDAERGAQAEVARRPEEAPIDRAAALAWDRTYVLLRAEYLGSSAVPDDRKLALRYNELVQRMVRFDLSRRRGEKPEIAGLLNDVWDYFTRVGNSPDAAFDVKSLGYFAVGLMDSDPAMEQGFIERLRQSPWSHLQVLADGWEQMRLLRNQPIDLKTTATDGTEIDVAALRGKIVLIDFWSLHCGGCIAAMPRLNALYRRYHAQGFEIVGLDFDEPSDRSKVDALMSKLKIPWKQSMQGGLNRSPLAKKYGLVGFPVTFLLDRNGRLVTNDLNDGQLEREVARIMETGGAPGKNDGGEAVRPDQATPAP